MLKAEILSDFGALTAIGSEWSEFVRGHPGSTPFQLPEWLTTWWAHFGSGELRSWAYKSEGKLAGMVPCFLHPWEGRRQLTLLGTGISDYLEPVIAREHAHQLGPLLARDLEIADDWDVCVWQDLDVPSALTEITANPRLLASVEADASCSEIIVDGSFEEYWNGRPHGLKRNVRRYLAKAKEIDTPQFSVTCKSDVEALNNLITLHTERWSRHGESGMLAANRSAAFLGDVVRVFAAEGLVRFFTLRFQETIVAVILGFAYRGVLYAYLSGFDPEYQALGFGRILLFEAIRHAFDNGHASWNFLRGTEPYKSEWGAREIAKQRLIVRRRD